MKNKSLVIVLLFSSILNAQSDFTNRSRQEFDESFKEKINNYALKNNVELKIVSVSSKTNPLLRIEIDGCYSKDGKALKVASWNEIKDYFRFTKKDRVLKPFVSKIAVEDEICSSIGFFKENAIGLEDKSITVSLPKLYGNTKRTINLTEEGSYIRINSYLSRFPLKKKINSQRIELRPLIKDLLLNRPSIDIALHDVGDIKINASLEMRYNGFELYSTKDFVQKIIPHPLLLLDVMAKTTELLPLFYSDSGVREIYTIREHTLRVLDLLGSQYSCIIDEVLEKNMEKKLNMPLKNFFQMTMALHDIGKPLAIQARDKGRQHEFTRPIMEKAFREWKLSEDAIELAVGLTDNDAIGDYLMGHIGVEKALQILSSLAKKNNLSDAEYFRLQMVFYTADAGSYPILFEKVFNESAKNKCLRPAASKFKMLEQRIIGGGK